MSQYAAKLTRTQAYYLSDALRQPPIEPPEERLRWRALLLQVLSATLSSDSTPVNLCEDDLFDMREVARTSAKMGNETVGLELLELCAKGLLALSADDYVHDAGMQVGLGNTEEPAASREKINQWKEEISHEDENEDGGNGKA